MTNVNRNDEDVSSSSGRCYTDAHTANTTQIENKTKKKLQFYIVLVAKWVAIHESVVGSA